MKQKIVMVGNIFKGHTPTFHGPFEDEEHAYQWIACNASNQHTVVLDLDRTRLAVPNIIENETDM